MSIPEPRISFATENAILLQFTEPSLNGVDRELQQRLCALAVKLRENPATDALLQEIVPGPGSLLLALYDGRKARRLLRYAETLWLGATNDPDTPVRTVQIPVRYGEQHGPDLTAMSAHTGLSSNEIIRRHSSATYYVQCLGFMAGFAYLGGLDPALATPRKRTPSARIGGLSTAIYPAATPGGWHVIGHTDIRLFDPHANPPSLLQPGDHVQFVPITDTTGNRSVSATGDFNHD
jgi:5-oxoprolinase (ATP-hydrolysing) subunit B